ncbi:putative transporter SVOPL [Latimeria chalumnae]|uniref:putative transporter SVOPL n=1 Tax=Latimeria chalumnae TaxID=7897 RepID=UPI00313F2C6F
MEIMLLAVVSPVIRCEWHLEDWQVALVTTMVFFGFMLCTGLCGFLADRYGRWKILLGSFLWGTYFSLLTSFSPTYGWFVFMRAMVGCGAAGYSQGYIIKTEFLPSKYRGYMLPLSQIFWLLGSVLVVVLGSGIIPGIGWRWLVRICTIPSIFIIIGFKFVPESARYNVSAGKGSAAVDTLQYIARMNRSSLPEGSLNEPIVENRGRFFDLFDSKFRRTTLQLWILWFGTAFAYYGLILASSELLERDLVCGAKEEAHEKAAAEDVQYPCRCQMFGTSDYNTLIISTLGEFALVPVNIASINLLGRRVSLGMTMTMTAVFYLLLMVCTPRYGLSALLFILRALVAANFNTIYVYTAEVYPTTVRGLGLGSSSTVARVGAMLAPFISQVLLNSSVNRGLSLFSAVCFVCAISAFLLPIETKGRALEQNT